MQRSPRTAVHNYTFTWPSGNAHFATSHGTTGSRMLSTTHPELRGYRQRGELAQTLRAWRNEAHLNSAFQLSRGVSGYI